MQPLQLVGLIGDVHGEDVLLDAALQFLAVQGVERVLCTGDVIDGASGVNRCRELLQDAGAIVVRGNHDRWFSSAVNRMRDLPDATPDDEVDPQTRQFLLTLPSTRELETVSGSLLLCHGLGRNDMARLMPYHDGYSLEANLELQELLLSQFRFVVHGHTHHRMVRSFPRARREPLTVINAGTLLRAHGPCFALADFERGQVQFFDAGANSSTLVEIF